MDSINELSTYLITVNFFDQTGTAITPHTIQYKINDVLSRTAILPWTSITPSGTSANIVISAAQNAILNYSNNMEQREVSVEFTYGTGNQGTAAYDYMVNNLKFLP